MGDLKGHVLPGLLCVAISCLWLWAWMHQYFKARFSSASSTGVQSTYKFKSSITFVWDNASSSDNGWRTYPVVFAFSFICMIVGILGKFSISFERLFNCFMLNAQKSDLSRPQNKDTKTKIPGKLRRDNFMYISF